MSSIGGQLNMRLPLFELKKIIHLLMSQNRTFDFSLTVIVTVGTVIGCSAKTKFCQMAPKSTENH